MTLLTLSRRWACGLLVLSACAPTGPVDTSKGSELSANQRAQQTAAAQPGTAASQQAPNAPATGNCTSDPGSEYALCVCDNLTDVGLLIVENGSGGAGSVGVNGRTDFVNASRIAGDLTSYQSFHAVAASHVLGSVSTSGDASWVGAFHVGGDLDVGGNARALGLLNLDGTLRVAGETALLGLDRIQARGDYQPVTKPCPCDPGSLIDVAKAVGRARADNDNQASGLSQKLRQIGLAELRLSDGSYYFEDVASIGAIRFVIAGKVSMYVDGTLDSIGLERLKLEPDAELDLYVSGGLRQIGLSALGNHGADARMRIYVGGDDAVVLSVGAQIFHGSLYAPRAAVAYVGDANIVGSVFARTLHGIGVLTIDHESSSSDPGSCNSDDAGTPSSDDDAGTPPVDTTDAGTPPAGDGDGDTGTPVEEDAGAPI